MEKRSPNLVHLPGCEGCGRHCKYNAEIADPLTASQFSRDFPYGCNSKLQGFELEEGVGHGIQESS